jgi:hypothetical protein
MGNQGRRENGGGCEQDYSRDQRLAPIATLSVDMRRRLGFRSVERQVVGWAAID